MGIKTRFFLAKRVIIYNIGTLKIQTMVSLIKNKVKTRTVNVIK